MHQCIDSLLSQTYRNLEIILVNDGSLDRSGDICDEYAKINKHIQVIHKKNEGVAIARNVGLSVSRGEYIAFIDSDDWVAENYIERLFIKAKQRLADVVVCSWYTMIFNKKELIKKRKYKQALGTKIVDKRNGFIKKIVKPIICNSQKRTSGLYSPCNKLYRAEILKDNRIKFIPYRVHEDYYFNLEVFACKPKIVGLKEFLYFYRVEQSRDSMSNRLHAGVDLLIWRNHYFQNNFPEVNNQSYWYAKEVHKWFVSHRKAILQSGISEAEQVKKIQAMDNSDLYNWCLKMTGYSHLKTVVLANKVPIILKIKKIVKGLLENKECQK